MPVELQTVVGPCGAELVLCSPAAASLVQDTVVEAYCFQLWTRHCLYIVRKRPISQGGLVGIIFRALSIQTRPRPPFYLVVLPLAAAPLSTFLSLPKFPSPLVHPWLRSMSALWQQLRKWLSKNLAHCNPLSPLCTQCRHPQFLHAYSLPAPEAP